MFTMYSQLVYKQVIKFIKRILGNCVLDEQKFKLRSLKQCNIVTSAYMDVSDGNHMKIKVTVNLFKQERTERTSSRGHSQKLTKQHCNLDNRKHSFAYRTINI